MLVLLLYIIIKLLFIPQTTTKVKNRKKSQKIFFFKKKKIANNYWINLLIGTPTLCCCNSRFTHNTIKYKKYLLIILFYLHTSHCLSYSFILLVESQLATVEPKRPSNPTRKKKSGIVCR